MKLNKTDPYIVLVINLKSEKKNRKLLNFYQVEYVDREECTTTQKCHKKQDRECVLVQVPKTIHVPEMKCEDVPEEKCHTEYVEQCHLEQNEECNTKYHEECATRYMSESYSCVAVPSTWNRTGIFK